uniref:Contactin associated protein-like 5a n=1 Tax=Gasterosteus aculeatus aculeatus TaxID=481459 RepID=A0AAQ4RUD5_GASAC
MNNEEKPASMCGSQRPLMCSLSDSCSGPLVSTLPQSSFQSSSQSSASYAAHNGKLNRRDGAGGWSPVVTEQEPWLQVDLRERMEVTAVATQGRFDSWDWVSSYLLLYSDTGRAWKQYRHEDGSFAGNVNSEAVVQNKLSHSVRTRFLRFVPLDWNPSGWMGLRVEAYGCSYKSYVADFDGRSSLLYRFNQKSMSTVKDVVSLRFKSHQAEGVLLHGEGQRGDYMTLELHRGRLDLYLNLGSPSLLVGSLLDDQQWHAVHVERFNKQVNLTVDSHTQHFHAKGEGHSLEVDYEVTGGGLCARGHRRVTRRKTGFGSNKLGGRGVSLRLRGVNPCPWVFPVLQGNVTFSCSPPQLVACTFLSAAGSFLSLPSAPSPAGDFSARLQFRTWNPDGLLLSAWLNPERRGLELRINGSRLQLTLRGARPRLNVKCRSSGQRVDDGLWHSVSVSASNQQMTLTVDDNWPQLSLIKPRVLSLPGCPTEDCQHLTPDFQGCVRLIVINGHPMDLNRVQQGLLGNYNELQFDTCNIRDRCLPSLCEHGGRCSQTWSSFSCDCWGTGYSGAPCHTSIYESSCEAYRLIGSSSGFYSIDPDGSGPLGPTQVYCNMTEEKVWTVLAHNGTAAVAVQGSSLQRPHVTRFDYGASAEQLRAVVTGSEHCQQEVVYNSRTDRPFSSSADGSPLTWWLDRDGEKRSYWVGLLPGVQQCSCSLKENCVHRNYFCNCDADGDAWYTANDTGVLSYKDHLPVSQIVIGDTNRTGSQAVHRVGPLRCYGDKSLWNTVSFYQEASYLYFPTLQAELASDISFYFKTSAPSGVFLENQGLRDFIRVELAGDLNLILHAPAPTELLYTPFEGIKPSKMHLSTAVLPAGGTASQQRGFLGCIRTLTVNGAGFDLEERAKMAPGVTSGCPGYCSGSTSLCHNRGRCIEKSNGYVCDCSQSAYGGTTCNQEVSVSFDMESSVTYTFQEPFSVMQNRRSQASSVSAESSSRAREDAAFSFVTSQRPAMLLTVSTFSQQYIAVILARNGSLQIWYHLQTDGSPDVFSPVLANLADGRLHRIRIHRVGKNLYVQVSASNAPKYTLSSDAELILIRSLTLGKVASESCRRAASRGFIGCLSSVQFNHVAPLKAALTNRGSSLVSIRGPLVQSNCGALAESTSRTLQGETPHTHTRCKVKHTRTHTRCKVKHTRTHTRCKVKHTHRLKDH